MAIFLKASTFLACIIHGIYRTVYLLTLLLVAISNSFNVVVAWSQQRMEVATLRSKDSHSPIQYNDRPNNRLSTFVPHHATNPFMDLQGAEMEGKLMILIHDLRTIYITIMLRC